MKIALISDTHRQHDSLTMPEADGIIHAGDIVFITKTGNYQMQ